MANFDSRVTLVLDGSYGLRATEDAKRGPVWLIKSPKNAEAATELWCKFEGRGDYITIFDSFNESTEDACLSIIPDIDLHHPELSELTVVGVILTPRIRSVLGKGVFRETDDGFVLCRSDDTLTH